MIAGPPGSWFITGDTRYVPFHHCRFPCVSDPGVLFHSVHSRRLVCLFYRLGGPFIFSFLSTFIVSCPPIRFLLIILDLHVQTNPGIGVEELTGYARPGVGAIQLVLLLVWDIWESDYL